MIVAHTPRRKWSLLAAFSARAGNGSLLNSRGSAKRRCGNPSARRFRRQQERFHMAECDAGKGKFAGWTSLERETLIRDLRQIIIGSELDRRAMAVSRADWDEVVAQRYQPFFGNPETACFRECVNFCLAAARANQHDKRLTRVAHRPMPKPGAGHDERVLKRFERFVGDRSNIPELVDISFLSSELAVPLQGADMIAWETYRYAQDWLRLGRSPVGRSQLQEFVASGRFYAQIMDRESIDATFRWIEMK